MNKRKKVMRAIQSTSLAASIVAYQFVEKELTSDISWLPAVVAFLLAGCSLYVMQFILEGAFNNMRWLRHLLLGPQFIEGEWYILFRIEDKPFALGITQIMATEEGVKFQGDDFQYEGEGRGHYETDIATMTWPTMKYKYHYRRAIGEPHSLEGYGEAKFFEGNRRTDRFSGIFSELLGKQVTYFEGWRVPKNDLSALSDTEHPNRRKEKVVQFFKKVLEGEADEPQAQKTP